MKQIIKNTLINSGLKVDEYTNGLLVSLKSRKLSISEVDLVLLHELGIEMNMTSARNGVFIGTVALN